jgi:hypothetical protein
MALFFTLFLVIKVFMETIFKKVKDLIWACRKRRTWDHLVIHRRKLTENPPALILPLLCGHVKGKLSCPPELTILLVHNYDYEPIMEKSLRYVGIEDYTVLRSAINGPWVQTIKLIAILDYLKSDSCRTEYLLYCDSNDAVLRDDPREAIKYLEEENCDLLLSKTKSKKVYKGMPQVKAWTDQIAKEQGYPGWYINAGVFVARTSFLSEVLEAVMAYITDDDLPDKVLGQLLRHGDLGKRLPEFPKGCGSDQTILRYLHPQFYPRMKVDYKGRLALR